MILSMKNGVLCGVKIKRAPRVNINFGIMDNMQKALDIVVNGIKHITQCAKRERERMKKEGICCYMRCGVSIPEDTQGLPN